MLTLPWAVDHHLQEGCGKGKDIVPSMWKVPMYCPPVPSPPYNDSCGRFLTCGCNYLVLLIAQFSHSGFATPSQNDFLKFISSQLGKVEVVEKLHSIHRVTASK